MLVLAHADGLGVDLHQLGQGILEPPGDGQYQHDMPQARLDETLSGVVEDCVNAVGVDLNTASAPLLSYVAGLNNTTARNIVKYREENGAFTTRKGVLKVPTPHASAAFSSP